MSVATLSNSVQSFDDSTSQLEPFDEAFYGSYRSTGLADEQAFVARQREQLADVEEMDMARMNTADMERLLVQELPAQAAFSLDCYEGVHRHVSGTRREQIANEYKARVYWPHGGTIPQLKHYVSNANWLDVLTQIRADLAAQQKPADAPLYSASAWYAGNTCWQGKGEYPTVHEAVDACRGADEWRVEDEDGNVVADQRTWDAAAVA